MLMASPQYKFKELKNLYNILRVKKKNQWNLAPSNYKFLEYENNIKNSLNTYPIFICAKNFLCHISDF